MRKTKLRQNLYGQPILTFEDDLIGREIEQCGAYDLEGLALMEKILRRIPEAVCFDVGANIGNHALAMGRLASRVYLFEPNAKLHPLINESLALNHYEHCGLLPFGLGDENIQATLHEEALNNVGASTLVANLRAPSSLAQEVTLRIGDEVVKEGGLQKLDFIKLDVEGFETQALLGLRETLAKHRPILMMELNEHTKNEFESHQLRASLLPNYTCLMITNNHRNYLKAFPVLRKLTRRFYRLLVAKKMVLAKYDEALPYCNVILFPEEKASLVL